MCGNQVAMIVLWDQYYLLRNYIKEWIDQFDPEIQKEEMEDGGTEG